MTFFFDNVVFYYSSFIWVKTELCNEQSSALCRHLFAIKPYIILVCSLYTILQYKTTKYTSSKLILNKRCILLVYVVQGVSGGMVNILGSGSMEYSE